MPNENCLIIFSVLILIFIPNRVFGTQLTFELEDNTESCFNEMIEAEIPVTLDYQVNVNKYVFDFIIIKLQME